MPGRSSLMLQQALSLILCAVLPPTAHPLSFRLSELPKLEDRLCTGQKAICLQGDAFASNDILQLTANQQEIALNYSVGRAYYSERVRLWDRSTGELTNFTTSFSIDIKPLRNGPDDYYHNAIADGMAFFLSSNSSKIPPDSHGGYLGLMSAAGKGLTSGLVAVEFDTFVNNDTRDNWDPEFLHIGIDINSLNSASTAELYPGRFYNGSFSGTVRVSYGASTHNLSVLFFEESRGKVISVSHIVDLRKILSEWVIVGFSGSTGYLFELNLITAWEFESTLDAPLVQRNRSHSASGPPSPAPSSPIDPPIHKDKKRSSVGLLAGILTAVLLIIVAVVSFGLWKRKNKWAERRTEFELGEGTIHLDFHASLDEDLENDTGPRRFPYKTLISATNNFSIDRKLGVGGFGDVYRGFLSNSNIQVAVKRLSKSSKQGTKEYVSEINTISRLRHKNLVRLVGWCHEFSELLLVYEFMANGSLDRHLFNGDKVLNWPVRYNIALGLASAFFYLHTEWDQCVVHRDIKSSNVMLDDDFNAKLGDFGLARLIDHGGGMKTTAVAGTLGYLAPECVITGKTSKESDIYSFGMVLLEIACGRRSIAPDAEPEKVQLLNWVWKLYGDDRVLQAADPRLKGDFDNAQMERLMVVALWCAHPDLNSRPSMRQATAALNFEGATTFHLPKKMPLPIYSSQLTIGIGELPPGTPITSGSSYTSVPSNSASGTESSGTISTKSASSSTRLLASL